MGYARATVNIALIEKRQKNYNSSIRLASEALGVFKQQNNLLGVIAAANVLANDYQALSNYPEAIAYAKQNFDASLQLRELRGVSAACGTLSNIYADMGDKSEMVFSSLCAAGLIKQLRIDNLPHSGEDYQIFISRIRGATAQSNTAAQMLADAQARVRDIFIKLNLGVDTLRSEVASLQN